MTGPDHTRVGTILRRFLTAGRLIPAIGLLCYAVFLARLMGACAGGSDQSGYLNLARLLADGRASVAMRAVPELPPDRMPAFSYIPLGFGPNPDHLTMHPSYPPGLPLLIMVAARCAGWDAAPGLVMGLHALAGLWLTFILGRALGLKAAWAWFGALLLAASPLYIFLSVQTLSDLPAMVWVTAAILFAWKSRERTWLAFAAGAELSIGVLVRPTNILALLPVAIAIGPSSRRWLALIAGGVPGAMFLGGFNHAAYGHVLATGYGGHGSYFGWQCAPVTMAWYALWLPVLLTPLCLLSTGLPMLWRQGPVPCACLAAWAFVFPVFYLFYSFSHETWWFLRFVLPAFPAFIVAALLVGQKLSARLTTGLRPWWLAAAAIVVLANGALWSRRLHAFSVGRNELVYPQMAGWLGEHLPSNAVVAAMQTSGSLFYYTEFPVIRWDLIEPADFERIVATCSAAGRPVFAALHKDEIDGAIKPAFPGRLPGHWTKIGTVRHMSVWRFDDMAGAPSTLGSGIGPR